MQTAKSDCRGRPWNKQLFGHTAPPIPPSTSSPDGVYGLTIYIPRGPNDPCSFDEARPDPNLSRKRVESLVAQGVRFDVCLNTVDTVERETGKRPEFIAAATPVQVGVGQILALTENGYTLVRP